MSYYSVVDEIVSGSNVDLGAIIESLEDSLPLRLNYSYEGFVGAAAATSSATYSTLASFNYPCSSDEVNIWFTQIAMSCSTSAKAKIRTRVGGIDRHEQRFFEPPSGTASGFGGNLVTLASVVDLTGDVDFDIQWALNSTGTIYCGYVMSHRLAFKRRA